MNSVVLIGRLARDPEVRYTASQMAVARFTLAVSRMKKDDPADFISCVAFGKTAELIEQYMHKGSQMGLQGHIQTGSYQNKEGQTVYTTEVIVDRMEFVGSASGNSQQSSGFGSFGGSSAPSAPSNDVPPGFDALDDDIPF